LLLTKKVILKWNIKNKEWYINKGYKFTKMKDTFEVFVEDLSDGSHVSVDIQCDGCGKLIKGEVWKNYKLHVRKNNKYYCNKCAKNGDKKSLSFEEWCYEFLSKEEADRLLSRWDYKLNLTDDGIILNPRDISHGADVKYWFKCLNNPNHKSEQKSIHSCVCGEGTFDCFQCKSISATHPELTLFLKDKEDALKYTARSSKKIQMKCPNCGYEKILSPYVLFSSGFGCPKCSDGVSYPEKFTFNFLEQIIGNNFIVQLSKSNLKWCKNYKYDFYIPLINCIIETHGMQHYKQTSGFWGKLKNIQEKDKIKEQLAKDNGIENYIILDCRESKLEWIKDSVMNSELPKLLNFKEDDINWLKCQEYACKSLVKVVCECWENGKSTNEIVSELKIHKTTVFRYLKLGVKLGWCDYDGKNATKRARRLQQKKIICLIT